MVGELFKRLLPPIMLCATEVTVSTRGGTSNTTTIPNGSYGRFRGLGIYDLEEKGTAVQDPMQRDVVRVKVGDEPKQFTAPNGDTVTVKPLGFI